MKFIERNATLIGLVFSIAFMVAIGAIASSTVPTADTLNVHCFVGKGVAGRDAKLLDYDDSATLGSGTTANATYSTVLKLAPSATDTSVDLSSNFDNASYIAVKEISGATSGVLVGPATTSGNKFTVSGNGVFIFKNGAGTPPTLYFSNPSGTDTVYVEVDAVGNRT